MNKSMRRIGIISILLVFGISFLFMSQRVYGDSLSAPSNFKAKQVSSKSVKLSWSKVKDASGYVIYKYDKKKETYKKVKTISSAKTTSWKNTKLSPNSYNKYKIAAYKVYGKKKVYSSKSYTVSCKTATKNSKNTNVSSIKLNCSDMSVNEYNSKTIKAMLKTSSKGKKAVSSNVTWTSSDKKVATVSKTGKVTGVKAGTCKITCRAHNGISKSVKVTVKAEIAKEIPIITYHHVKSDEEKAGAYANDSFTVSKSNFEKQMKWLHENNYRTITCAEFQAWYEGKIELPRRVVFITIDDGYDDIYKYAMPILKKYNLKATCFIIGKFAEDSSSKGFMHLDTLSNLKNEYPNIELQSHTYNMHNEEGPIKPAFRMSYDEIMSDFEKMKTVMGYDYVAYPYGQYGKTMLKATQDSGVNMAFKYRGSPVVKATRKDSRFEIPRFKVHGKDNLKKFISYMN